jgi:hypothetical protein
LTYKHQGKTVTESLPTPAAQKKAACEIAEFRQIDRPYYYYLCPACHTGQFPADVALDIDKTDFSPGVRRMLAAVGGVAPFAQGRDQMKLLAGLVRDYR